MKKIFRSRKGAALIEYALLAAGVALVASAAVAVFGHKTSDMVAATAAIMPGAHADDNNPIVSAKIIETSSAEDGPITIDINGITQGAGTSRLGNNLLGNANGALIEDLVVEANGDG